MEEQRVKLEWKG